MANPETPPTFISAVPHLPPRAPDAHKGLSGHVALLAGSAGMSGAAVLCGLGALRGGAGLVRVLCGHEIHALVAGYEPSLMVHALPAVDATTPEGRAALRLALQTLVEEWADAVAAGPGLGTGSRARIVVRALLEGVRGPLVLDADALNILAANPQMVAPTGGHGWWDLRAGRPTVLTPHPGEMARLQEALKPASGAGVFHAAAARGNAGPAGTLSAREAAAYDDARIRTAREYAALSGAVVVLKGHRTVVADAQRVFINTTGNPGMATGGMGDVLTGLVAAVIGQGLAPFEATCLAVHAHGAAADRVAERIGPAGYLAREVADALPVALRG